MLNFVVRTHTTQGPQATKRVLRPGDVQVCVPHKSKQRQECGQKTGPSRRRTDQILLSSSQPAGTKAGRAWWYACKQAARGSKKPTAARRPYDSGSRRVHERWTGEARRKQKRTPQCQSYKPKPRRGRRGPRRKNAWQQAHQAPDCGSCWLVALGRSRVEGAQAQRPCGIYIYPASSVNRRPANQVHSDRRPADQRVRTSQCDLCCKPDVPSIVSLTCAPVLR